MWKNENCNNKEYDPKESNFAKFGKNGKLDKRLESKKINNLHSYNTICNANFLLV